MEKQKKISDQTSDKSKNGSGVGNQFEPNAGAGAIEDTEPKKTTDHSAKMGTHADDPTDDSKDKDENSNV